MKTAPPSFRIPTEPNDSQGTGPDTADHGDAMTQDTARAPDFSRIETWVFDLDNTLYAADAGIFEQVDRRMSAFIAEALGVPRDEAYRLQKLYYREHGTTLSGLTEIHGIEPKDFLDYVHDIDVSIIDPDHRLDAAIARLPGRKVIYTNGTVQHAENVLDRLGVRPHFESIFDIVAANYIPKPRHSAYRHIMTEGGIDPSRAVMFEDIARNLEAAHALGMTTVWVRPAAVTMPGDGDNIDPDELAGHPHIHHVTDDLAAFLDTLHVAPAG